jgi:diguanylate cyclase (GGDEF)-like protein
MLLSATSLATAGYVVQHTSHLRQTLERLSAVRPAVIVIDPLSHGAGVELEAIERTRTAAQPVPVLVVSEAGDPGPAVLCGRALERGSWDLVARSAPPEEFLMRVQRLQQLALRMAEMDILRHRAAHDDRTDLLRPHAFQDRLREHVSAAQRHRFDLALLLIDLDHFGKVNKLHDHTVGDLVIARVGEVIRKALRTEDVAGRLGGDEFAVLLPYTKKVDAAHVVQRLLDEIKDISGRLPGAKGKIEISASVGFETFSGTDLEGLQALRLHAEESLRHAKARGGNQGVYFRSLEGGRASASGDQDQA